MQLKTGFIFAFWRLINAHGTIPVFIDAVRFAEEFQLFVLISEKIKKAMSACNTTWTTFRYGLQYLHYSCQAYDQLQ